MKVIMFKVRNCKECPVGQYRITSWPHSEPVCTLFMDENEPGRRGRVIDENVFNISIPSWCPLDNMIEIEDDEYEITANNHEKDPKFNWSRLHNDIVKWRDII